jgi:hypothetical protein
LPLGHNSNKRHLGKFCTTKGTEKQQEKKISARARKQQQQKKRTRQVCTASSSRHRVKPLSHGLLSLEMLFFSISQGLLRFLRLS